jgi:hypothetical protein
MLTWVKAVHAIESAQQSRFATARRANESGDSILLNIEINLLQTLKFSIVKIKILDLDGIFRGDINHKFPE